MSVQVKNWHIPLLLRSQNGQPHSPFEGVCFTDTARYLRLAYHA